MTYSVKEIFYTLQGEGAQTGHAAVFLRFSGCNLWTGKERHRSKAICQFCDTDFVGTDGVNGGKYASPEALANVVESLWPTGSPSNRLVVCTGGEPLLQLDAPLIDALHRKSFRIAVETNGTVKAAAGIDWLCVSPKAGTQLVQTCGQELKLVFPQPAAMPGAFEDLDFTHLFLQPMDGPDQVANTQAAIDYCMAHPKWRLSLQMHKIAGID
jgi:7-carboxy-7-deazaguanine synthase